MEEVRSTLKVGETTSVASGNTKKGVIELWKMVVVTSYATKTAVAPVKKNEKKSLVSFSRGMGRT